MFLNKLQIIGRLCQAPEAKTTPGGKTYASFTIAVNRYRQGPDGKILEEVDFFHAQAYGFKAEKVLKLKKGALVYSEGSLESHKHEDKLYWNLKVQTIRRLEGVKAEPEADEEDV